MKGIIQNAKLLLFVAVLSFMMASCTRETTKIREVAEGFLTAYFQMDYETAYTFCDAELSETLQMTIEGAQTTDEEILAKIRETSKNTRFEITSVIADAVPDYVSVDYNIYVPNTEIPISKRLGVTKIEGRWRVSELR